MLQGNNSGKMDKPASVEGGEREKRQQFTTEILEITKEIVDFYQQQVDNALNTGFTEADEIVQVLRYNAYCVRAVKQRIIEGYPEHNGDNVQLPPCFPYKVALAYMYLHHILELCIMEDAWEQSVGAEASAEAHQLIDKLDVAFEKYDPFALEGIPKVEYTAMNEDDESTVELDTQEDSQLIKRKRN